VVVVTPVEEGRKAAKDQATARPLQPRRQP